MTAADRVWPPPDGRERIEGRAEGGWIATGKCGRPHLIGRGWSWWRCKPCARRESRDRILARQQAALAVFYPEPRRGWWQP